MFPQIGDCPLFQEIFPQIGDCPLFQEIFPESGNCRLARAVSLATIDHIVVNKEVDDALLAPYREMGIAVMLA